jgi:hypothetical protein
LLCSSGHISKLPTTLSTSRLSRRKGRIEPMNIRAISTTRTDLLTMLIHRNKKNQRSSTRDALFYPLVLPTEWGFEQRFSRSCFLRGEEIKLRTGVIPLRLNGNDDDRWCSMLFLSWRGGR